MFLIAFDDNSLIYLLVLFKWLPENHLGQGGGIQKFNFYWIY